MTAVSQATDVRSQELFAEAQKLIPGGVNSPVRAFRAVGGAPRFIARAEGPFVYDADGNQLVDYVLSYGPLVMGHAHPEVVAAIVAQAARVMARPPNWKRASQSLSLRQCLRWRWCASSIPAPRRR